MAGTPTRNGLLVSTALLAVGCFNSHNPGTFPYYVSGGPIEQDHAKPRFGFFRDFDPQACKLDIALHPQNGTVPVGGPVVLVATVSDAEGQPRRSRRVEWIVEGPGNIVEVDESGLYAGRGYKVDNKYAVTYTGYTSHTLTRGNTDTADDVEIGVGKTFCVVSSAVAGETTVTAYAPGVFNWDKGRVVTKIVWGEGRFRFPAPAVVRSGGEYTLTTSVTSSSQDGPIPPAYRVRYRVLDGSDRVAAVLVVQGGVGTNGSQSGTSAKEAEAPVDATGNAAVRLIQPTPMAGKTRLAVEIIKPPETGIGPGEVVSRRDTHVEWAMPAVKLEVTGPTVSPPAAAVPFTVTLANTGPVDAAASQVRVNLPTGVRLESSEPAPNRQDGSTLIFDLPPVASSKRLDVVLRVLPPDAAPAVTLAAEVTTEDGLTAKKEATTQLEPGRLAVVVAAPATARTGERVVVRIAVTNTGATPTAHTTVWAALDPGLVKPGAANPVELSADTLAPGETKTLELPIVPKVAGRYSVRTDLRADGDLSAAGNPITIDVHRAELAVKAEGPAVTYLNQEYPWTVTVSNRGDTTLMGVVVRATLPPDVRMKEAKDGKLLSTSIEWRVAELKSGGQQKFTATLEGARLADRAVTTLVATAEHTGTTANVGGDRIEAKASSVVAVLGSPSIVLQLATPTGALALGKHTTCEIRVRNAGTVVAHNIEVVAFVSPEFKVTRASGKTEGQTDANGKVTFPKLDELDPGQTIVFTIEADAAVVGDGRIRAEVQAEHIPAPLKEEQAIRVVGGR